MQKQTVSFQKDVHRSLPLLAKSQQRVGSRRGSLALKSVMTREETRAEVAEKKLEASHTTSSTPSTLSGTPMASAPRGSNATKVAPLFGDELKSSWEHRAWTYGVMAVVGTTFAGAAQKAAENGPADVAGVAGALLAAYLLSDLGSGIYHWGVDNWGSAETPLVGRQIAAFQGHHARPWTITQREFCNNVHQVFKPAALPAAVFLLLSPFLPTGWNAFESSFIFFICMSQQFHAWSHMKKSELHPLVLALQDAGVLISRKAHGAHHRNPFSNNYCIVSGVWNAPLDQSGFFHALESAIHQATGIEPRCWSDPIEGWAEEKREGVVGSEEE